MFQSVTLAICTLGLTLLLPLTSHAAPAPSPAKRIEFRVDPFPNYVFHLYALGKIGYASPYSEHYTDTLPERDRSYLMEHKDLLAFANGGTGPLSVAFLFFPLYLNFASPEEMNAYLDRLNAAVDTGDASALATAYGKELDRVKLFLPFEIGPYVQSIAPRKDTVRELGRIYRENYLAYLETVWPQEKPRLDEQAAMLKAHIAPLDLIRKWEEATGLTFRFDTYELALCRAAEGGPNAISAGYERNHFFYTGDIGYFTQFVSHETGTHILIEAYHQAMGQQRYPFSTVYSAYESLAMFYNKTRIFPGEKFLMNFENYDSDTFLTIYAELTRENPGIKAGELLQKGLERYAGGGKTGK